MPLSFPIGPDVGDQYTLGTKTWEWTGVTWDLVSVSDVQVAAAETAASNAATSAASAASAVLGSVLTGLSLVTGTPITSSDAVLGAFGKLQKQITDVLTSMALLAPKANPTFTGTVTGITASMVGLGSVNNTADTAKPVSTAQQAAIDLANTTSVPNAQTGTTYTLVLADAGKRVTMSNASANTVTIPPNSSVAFPINTTLFINQIGAGATSIAAGAGVTINTAEGLKVGGQYKMTSVIKTATDTWMGIGSVA